MDPSAALRLYWGYDSFRPLQERIIRGLLDGRDTCVVMPTGGGKSLCYQLPAALSDTRTVIVVSPLIALMQDQVAQLSQMGVDAALLNSSVSGHEQSVIMEKARAGAYRLIYLSPERLARQDTVAWLQRVPISFFAIDEAHCISEWGHEFRPDYRQLSTLRAHFPGCHIAAFTASATRHVRHDIIEQLQLRNPHKYIASFHRPNLRYLVKLCDATTHRPALLAALRHHVGENVIVYAPTIAQVEATVDFLEERGIAAIPYHGQMDADTRRQNQERWMADDVRVLVGTIAFGLGINKASVRAVIHLSLPKSLEQYYQEAGRAGRDGKPADCLLFWQKRDAGLLAHFIEQIGDNSERQRAWQRYRDIRNFVESEDCRHRRICCHFGETPKWRTCGACDVCGSSPEWLSGLADESGNTRRGKKRKSALQATAARKPAPAETPKQAAPSQIDSELRDYLREWRRTVARERGVPAYVIMHDTSMDDLCRIHPKSLRELRTVFGFGERKTEQHGKDLLDALDRFRKGARTAVSVETVANPAEETLRLVAEGKTFSEIAAIRARRLSTVVEMIANLIEQGRLTFQPHWVTAEAQRQIEAACQSIGLERLKPLKDALPSEIAFDDIRLVVARLRQEKVGGGQKSSPG